MLFAAVLSILLLVFLLFWLLLWKLPQWQVAAVPEIKDRLDLESKSRQTMAQILGGAALLVGLYFTAQTLRTSQETLRTTQEGQITDCFTKAITQLGDNNLAVRLGGIYALERIAIDSEKDHWSVMEVLTTFVREQTQLRLDTEASTPKADIQSILTVLGRRKTTHRMEQQYGLNLSKTQLRRANLWAAKFQKAQFAEAQLQNANFTAAHLQQAVLKKAQLKQAVFWEAECQGADFTEAQLQGAFLWQANLQGAILTGAQLQGADLTGVKNLTQEQINETCIDDQTTLPEGLTRPDPCPTKQ